MKYLILFFAFTLSISAFAQQGLFPLDSEKHIYYSDSGQPQLSQAELYRKVQNWVTKSFGNYKNAVSFEDSVNGKLRVTSYVPVIHENFAYVRFDLTVNCEDNSYQADIKNLDGVSPVHSPERLSVKENERIGTQEVLINAETNKRRRAQLEEELKLLKAEIDGINTAMYNLLGSLKQSLN